MNNISDFLANVPGGFDFWNNTVKWQYYQVSVTVNHCYYYRVG